MGILDKVIKQPTPNAPKGVVYGPPGIGKTTFGATIPNCLLIDLEGGAGAHSCQRTPKLDSWLEVDEYLQAVVTEKHEFDAIAIDTLDWLVVRIEQHVSGANASADSVTNTLNRSHGGYGNGKQVMKNHLYQQLLPTLDKIVVRGIAVIMLAHADRQEITDIDGITTEKTSPEIPPDYRSVFIEWSDFVCLAQKRGEHRIMITSETSKALAKNRYDLPLELNFDSADFFSAVKDGMNKRSK